MKSMTVNGVKVHYIQKRSDRKSISASVDNDGTIEIRTPKWVNDDCVRRFIGEYSVRILRMISDKKRKIEYEERLGPDGLEKLKKTAQSVIPERVKYYSEIMGVKPGMIRINSARTRFGSCSGKGNLNFSCRLMAYSANAVDYVVVHELAHLVYMNHSASFWDLVGKYKPDFKEAQRELKKIPEI